MASTGVPGIAYPIDLVAHAADHEAMGIATTNQQIPLIDSVSWVGTGASQEVDTPFLPEGLLIFADGKYLTFTHRYMWRKATAYFANAVPHIVGGVDFGTDSFTVGTDTSLNALGVTYTAVVLNGNGSNQIKFGAYCGNAVDGRAVTHVGFQPEFIFVKRDNTYPAWSRFSNLGANALPGTSAAPAANIKTLAATGFTVNASEDTNAAVPAPNSGGEGYDFIAFAASSKWSVGRYVGSGAAKTITADISGPIFGIFKSEDTSSPQTMHFWSSEFPAGQSKNATNSALVSDGVTGVSGHGITLGTNATVNASGKTYSYFVMKRSTAPVFDVDEIATRQAFRVDTTAGGMLVTSPSAEITGLLGAHSIEVLSDLDMSGVVDQGMFGYNTNSTNYQYSLAYLGTLQQFIARMVDVGGQRAYNITGCSGERRMRHYVFTYDGVTSMQFAVDGEVVKQLETPALTMVAGAATPVLTFGCRNSSGTRANGAVGGLFYLARLYSSALTPAQINQRYRRSALLDMAYNDVDCVEEWDARNISGTTLYATKNAANNGTLANTTTV